MFFLRIIDIAEYKVGCECDRSGQRLLQQTNTCCTAPLLLHLSLCVHGVAGINFVDWAGCDVSPVLSRFLRVNAEHTRECDVLYDNNLALLTNHHKSHSEHVASSTVNRTYAVAGRAAVSVCTSLFRTAQLEKQSLHGDFPCRRR